MRFESVAMAVADGRPVLRAMVRVESAIVFFPRFHVRIVAADGSIIESHSASARELGWLPRGTYRVDFTLPQPMALGPAAFTLRMSERVAMQEEPAAVAEGSFHASPEPATPAAWLVEAQAPAPPLASLSWNKGHADWFFRHFDHAALTVQSYLLGDSPLLRGRILDVGCGDGITDLALALRTGCRELVGVDPFRGYERLGEVLDENHVPRDVIPPSLRFLPEDANHLPFEDDAFDVLVSWGSVEHIAGGYAQAMAEMRRVLRPGGLLFIHPGLYYSNYGHHLGEFSSEPHFHLKRPLDEVRRIVMEAPMNRMDRSGHVATREEYWQWFRELNPITVSGFERELRALDFQPWRVALRTEPMIEYSAEIERYPMQDLATAELYVSCWNRKPAR
jgi:SAM-dependent methyltransferase